MISERIFDRPTIMPLISSGSMWLPRLFDEMRDRSDDVMFGDRIGGVWNGSEFFELWLFVIDRGNVAYEAGDVAVGFSENL